MRDSEARIENRPGFRNEHVARSEQPAQQSENAKHSFAREDARQQEGLRLREPDDGDIHAGEFEWDGGDQQNRPDGGENYERRFPAARHRELADRELRGAEKQQDVKREFRMHRLILHQGEQQARIQQRRGGGHVFLGCGLNPARDVGPAVNRPVHAQQHGARHELREHVLVGAHRLDHGAQPNEVIQIRRDEAENFELEPVAAVDDGDEANRENCSGGQAVDRVLADGNRGERQQEREAGDNLRVVAQRVADHRGGHDE